MERLKNVIMRPGCDDQGIEHRPFIIAEAGVNHEGSMSLARRLIDEAAESGADAIKFQTYRAETIACQKSPAYWDLSEEPTNSQYQLFKKYDKFWKKEFEELRKYCDETGIDFLSTPFDKESADFLNDLMDVFKISSSDITNKPFINHICSFQKPIILSTGASNIDEIRSAVSWIESTGVAVALLHCVLEYPTPRPHANIRMIQGLKECFPDHAIGYSDHTLPGELDVLIMAWALGAVIIEKHFTYDKKLVGNDHYHSADRNDIKKFFRKLTEFDEIFGEKVKRSIPSEAGARRHARRSLVTATRIVSGTKITSDMLTWKRPGHGISPSLWDQVIGRVTERDIDQDEMLQWGMLSGSK